MEMTKETTSREDTKQRVTKKQQMFQMYDEGLNVEMIAEALHTSPTYVANTLAEAGIEVAYTDLYTSTTLLRTSRYARQFAGVLRFRDMDAARESVRRFDELYHLFQTQKDRRGQHHAQALALVGMNRAAGIGKTDEANLFSEWLREHLGDEQSHEMPWAA